jgi:hypothetical protein
MRAGPIVIFHVRQQQVTEVALAEHNNMVKAFPVPVGNSILLATDIESGDAPALCERSVT